jgi:hypothetical protein
MRRIYRQASLRLGHCVPARSRKTAAAATRALLQAPTRSLRMLWAEYYLLWTVDALLLLVQLHKLCEGV